MEVEYVPLGRFDGMDKNRKPCDMNYCPGLDLLTIHEMSFIIAE